MLAGSATAVPELGTKKSMSWVNSSGCDVPGGELELRCEDRNSRDLSDAKLVKVGGVCVGGVGKGSMCKGPGAGGLGGRLVE